MGVLQLGQTWLADSGFADYLRVLTFAHLESLLSDTTAERLPVVVIGMDTVKGGTLGDPLHRDALWKIVDDLRSVHAAAVGIDNDFSPGPAGWLVRNGEHSDPKFFAHCLEVSHDMPVFLGTYRNADLNSDRWLGLPQFSALAAYIGSAPAPDGSRQTRAQAYYRDPSGRQVLPSVGYALARAYVARHARGVLPAPGPLLSLVVEPMAETQQVQLLNFSKVGQMTRESIWLPNEQAGKRPGIEQMPVVSIPHYFEGKIVLVGDVDLEKERLVNSTDSFFAPGTDRLPGVLYHASAAYTFGFEPVYEFKETTRRILDVCLAAIFLLAVWVQVRYQHQSRGVRFRILRVAEQYALFVAAVLLVLVAVVAMRVFHVLWLDAAWVALGLLVHLCLPTQVKELFPRWTGGDYEEAK
ncbi:CHASE2 domain-containing sensor protein [Paraburkholderia sp. RAU6.4a]|uniref:CHASE2 domain-containing protein n=1 Tax=Paraburkholderia sp. RAU6.4a TaxID=2991067 RepID=UPI003D23A014